MAWSRILHLDCRGQIRRRIQGGERHGHGVAVFADGSKFEGEWVDSKPLGRIENATPFNIEWKRKGCLGQQHSFHEVHTCSDNCRLAILTYSTGLIYKGEIKDGKDKVTV